jgi:peptidoglycan/LPS O-acetylase OafA/YrhL
MPSTSFLFLLLAAAVLQTPCQAQYLHKVSEIWQRQAHLEALNRYPNLRKQVLDAITSLEDMWTAYSPQLMESESDTNISDACSDSIMAVTFGKVQIMANVTMPEMIPMLDATGKQGAGLLDGNLVLNAAFDECFGYNYTGYCMGKVNLSFIPPSIPLSWSAGLCVPKHCTPHDVAAVMNFTRVFKVDESQMKCTDTKTPAYSPGAIVMIIVCAVFVMLVIVGTILDKVREYIMNPTGKADHVAINSPEEKVPLLHQEPVAKKKSMCTVKWHEFLTAFSLYKTVPTLLATKQAPGIITSMNGLRAISMFWVILGHTYVWGIFQGHVDNALSVEKELIPRFSFQAILNGTFSVDSFFFLSGVLVAYLTLRQMKKRKGRFPFLHYYLHRYLRLTPTYAFVLFFAWFLTNHIAAGPTFPLIDSFGPQCAKYWWTNLLYINNLYPWKMADQCIGWAWYLANDMQFFIISPLMLIPAYFLLPVGAVISSALLLCSFIVTATLAGVFKLTTSFINADPASTAQYGNLIYEKPWARISPYIIGLALGYVFYRGIRLPFSRIVNTILYLIMWMATVVLLAAPLYGLYSEFHGHKPSTAENVIYTTFSRCSWGLGLALLVFACHNGYGGLINTFLSMKIWTPLSRMTFNAYLVHPVVLTVVYGQMQKTFHATDITMATFAVAFVVLSYAVAGVVCVAVEFPLGSVEMLLFKTLGLEGRKSQRQGPEPDKKGEEEGEKSKGQDTA